MSDSTSPCPTPSCASCKKPQTDVPQPLKRCAKCQSVFYCSRECQTANWPTHKRSCVARAVAEAASAQNYILNVRLRPDDIVDPIIIRTLSCPAGATFKQLHQALQIAFGWATTHTYDFKVKDPAYEEPEDEDAMAALVRRISGNADHGLGRLGTEPRQYLLRIVGKQRMGPRGFGAVDMIHSGSRSHPKTPEKRSEKVQLYEVFDKPEYQYLEVEYEYDFGDCWERAIILSGRAEHTDHFICTAGEGHPCAEDVGSARGWQQLKEAYRAARPSAEQREKMKWFETQASNSDPAGLAGNKVKQWDQGGVNRLLASMR